MATENRRKLSPEVLRRAPVRTKRYRIWDSIVPQLFVSVQPTGVKSFNVQWSRERPKSIGKFPGMTVEAARAQALDILNDASKHGTPAVAQNVPTFAVFIDKHYAPWVTVERKAGTATVANLKAQFGELFGAKPLTEISAFALERFKVKRLKAGIAPVTVNRDLDRISAALSKAVAWKMLPTNPVFDVKDAKVDDDPRVRYLDADEEKRLRAALAAREVKRRRQRISGNARAKARGRELRPVWAPDEYTDHLMPVALLAMNTGLRRGELLGLKWDQIDLKRKQLRVAAATSKTARVRFVPLNAEAMQIVERLHKHSTKTGFLFRGRKGSALTHIKRSWSALMEAAELKDLHLHDLRHHFASRLVMADVDLYTVQQLLGHADAKQTTRYAHLSPEHRAAAVAKLGRR